MGRIARIVILVLLVVATPLVAQAQYTVQANDTLWGLAGKNLDSAAAWETIYEANPFLKEAGRRFVDQSGRTIVVLRPGEQLAGLDKLGIVPSPVVPQPTPPATPVVVEKSAPAQPTKSSFDWWPLLIALIIALVAYGIYRLMQHRRTARAIAEMEHRDRVRMAAEARDRELRRTPSEVGPPMVAGGIPPTDGARIENFFDQQATATFAQRNPQYTGVEAPVRIGPVIAGIMHGDGQTLDLNRVWHDMHIDLPGRQAYMARFRYPDGTEEDMKAWQECMNLVRAGGGMRGFTFVPNAAGGIVVETPEPPTPAPQPVPHPAMAVARIRAAAESIGDSTITVGDRVITVQRGAHFTVDDATGTITVSGGSFEMKVRSTAPQAEATSHVITGQ